MTLQEAVQSVAEASSQQAALRRAYDILTAQYHGERLKTYLLIWRLFEMDAERLWRREGFLHCTKLNQLLRYLLTRSGWFSDEDILTRWTTIWLIFPHQYIRVRLKDEAEMAVDVWAAAKGISYGDYAHGFH